MAEQEKTPTITDVKNVLSNACGGYSKMYLAAYAWCGGDYKAKSRAVVLTAIIDYVASKQKDIKAKPGENPWYLFTDSHWQERLQMDRGTMKSALDWLEKVGLVSIRKFGAGKGEIPKRHISLDLGTLVTLIRETQDRGPEASKVRHPTILDSGEIKPYTLAPPKKERERGEGGKFKATAGNPAGVTAGVSAVTPVKFRQSNAGVSADATAGNSQEYLREIPPDVAGVSATKNMLEDTEKITDIMEDDIALYCSGEQSRHTEEVSATRPASGSASLRDLNNISDFSGNSAQQPKPSETKETKLPNLPGKDVESAPPLTPEEGWAKAQKTMEPLSALEGGLWYSVGYDKAVLAKTVQRGWKYAVRGSALLRIRKLSRGTKGIPTWEFTDDAGKADQSKANALVQAWLQYADREGMEDPWAPLAGMDQDTRWTEAFIQKHVKDAPAFDDPVFNKIFNRLLDRIS